MSIRSWSMGRGFMGMNCLKMGLVRSFEGAIVGKRMESEKYEELSLEL